MVTNPRDHPRFQAVFVGRTPSVTALALRDVVVAYCPMEDFSTTSSSATQPLHLKVYASRLENRLVLVAGAGDQGGGALIEQCSGDFGADDGRFLTRAGC